MSVAIYTRCTQLFQPLDIEAYFRQEPGYRAMEDIIKYRDSELRSVGRAFDQRYTPPQRRRDAKHLSPIAGPPVGVKSWPGQMNLRRTSASDFVDSILLYTLSKIWLMDNAHCLPRYSRSKSLFFMSSTSAILFRMISEKRYRPIRAWDPLFLHWIYREFGKSQDGGIFREATNV